MRLLLSCLILLLPYFFSGQSAVPYLDKMVESISTIQTLKYEFHSKELIDGQFINSHVGILFFNFHLVILVLHHHLGRKVCHHHHG